MEVSNLKQIFDLFNELEEIEHIQLVHDTHRFMEIVLDKEQVPIERLGLDALSFRDLRIGIETLGCYYTMEHLDGAEVIESTNGPEEYFGYWFDDLEYDDEEIAGVLDGAIRCNEYHPLHEREHCLKIMNSFAHARSKKIKTAKGFF